MKELALYIPTKGRPYELDRLLNNLKDIKYDIYVGLEKEDYDYYNLICENFKKINKIFIEEKNKGLGNSLFWGTKHLTNLKYKNILICDDNVTPPKNINESLDLMLNTLNSNKNLVLVSGIQKQFKYWKKFEKDLNYTWSGCYVFYMFKTQIIKDGASFDQEAIYSSDSDFGLSIIKTYKAKKQMAILNNIIYRKPRHQDGGSLARDNRNEIVQKTYEYMQIKWGNYFRICERRGHKSYHSLPLKYIKDHYAGIL